MSTRLRIGQLNDRSTKCQVLTLIRQLVQRQRIASRSVLAGFALVWPVSAGPKPLLHPGSSGRGHHGGGVALRVTKSNNSPRNEELQTFIDHNVKNGALNAAY